MSLWYLETLFNEILLPMTITGGLLVVLLGLLHPLLKKLGPGWQYLFWSLSSLFFLIPLDWIEGILPHRSPILEQTLGLDTVQMAIRTTPLVPVPSPIRSNVGNGGNFLSVGQVLAILWGLGILILLVKTLWSILRFRQLLRRNSQPVTDPAILALYQTCVEEKRLHTAPALRSCSLTGSPILVGVFRPVIFLPTFSLSQKDLRLALLHELTHFKNRDPLLKSLALAARILHWFNPAAWVLERRLNTLCEFACDMVMVQGMDQSQRKGYSMAILNMMGASWSQPPLSSAFSQTKENLRKRLSLILEQPKPSRKKIVIGACGALVLIAAGIWLASYLNYQSAIGIIGGADGPTAIFIASKANEPESQEDLLMKQLISSVKIEDSLGLFSFTIPETPPPQGAYWNILVSGRMRMGEDSGMSFHWFEQENADGAWVPGQTYQQTFDGPSLLELGFDAWLLDASGEQLAYQSVSWTSADTQALQLSSPLEQGEDLQVAASFSDQHPAVDLAAKEGDSIYAMADGVLLETGQDPTLGNYLLIGHGNGTQSLYASCGEISAQAGDLITQGQPIGKVGRSGASTGPHLHLALFINEELVDPLDYLSVPAYLYFRF